MDDQGDRGKVQHKCRTCLSQGKNMKSLLENSNEMKKLLIKFKAVTKVEISPNSVYPAYICNICEEKVITFYEFQQNYRSSNDIICAYIQNIPQKQIKIEDNSIDCSESVDNPNEMFSSQSEVIPRGELGKFSKSDSDQNGSDALDNTNLESHSDLNDINESDMVEGESFQSINDVNKSSIPQDGNSETTKNALNNTNEPKYVNMDVEGPSSKINEGLIIKTRRGLYKCRFCHYRANIIHNIKIHERIHTGGRTCVCNICGKDFLGLAALAEHKRIHFCKLICCKICGRRFSSRNQLKIHMKGHRGQSATNISGLINTKAENNVMELDLKDKNETCVKIEERSTILEPILSEKRVVKKYLGQRVNKKYPREVINMAVIMVKKKYLFNCIYCNFVGGNKRQLRTHMVRGHRKFMTNWCSTCNQVFDDLKKHESHTHFECPLCNKYRCNVQSTLIDHLYCHLDEKRFKCEHCEIRFQEFKSLKKHTLQKHPSHSKNTDGTYEIFNSENSDVVSNDPIENQPNIRIAEIGISCSQSNEDAIPGIEGGQCKPSCSSVTTNTMGECITVNTGKNDIEGKNNEIDSTTDTNTENSNMELNCEAQEVKKIVFKKYSRDIIENAVIMVKKKYYHVECVCCEFVALSQGRLRIHMKNSHSKMMTKWCSVCNQILEDLENHQICFHHFECPFCTYKAYRKPTLLLHLYYHSAAATRLKCTICDMAFGSLYILKAHKQLEHSRDIQIVDHGQQTTKNAEFKSDSDDDSTDSNCSGQNENEEFEIDNNDVYKINKARKSSELIEMDIPEIIKLESRNSEVSTENPNKPYSADGGNAVIEMPSLHSDEDVLANMDEPYIEEPMGAYSGCDNVEEKNNKDLSPQNLTETIKTNSNTNINELDFQKNTGIYEQNDKDEEIFSKETSSKEYPGEDVENASIVPKKEYDHVNCICCNFVASNKRHLPRHMKTSHRELLSSWCSLCNQLCGDKKMHKCLQDNLFCQMCNKYMWSKLSLLIHHLEFHSDENRVECDVCGVRCQTLDAFKPHRAQEHTSISIAKKNYNAKSDLTNLEDNNDIINKLKIKTHREDNSTSSECNQALNNSPDASPECSSYNSGDSYEMDGQQNVPFEFKNDGIEINKSERAHFKTRGAIIPDSMDQNSVIEVKMPETSNLENRNDDNESRQPDDGNIEREGTLAAAKILRAPYQRILKESAKITTDNSTNCSFASPRKKRRIVARILDLITPEQMMYIRNLVYNFYIEEKRRPSINLILQKARDQAIINTPLSISSFGRLLKRLGFRWRKTDDNRKALMEKHGIRINRIKYLKDITKYRTKRRNIVYTYETYVHSSRHTSEKGWFDDSLTGIRKPIPKGQGHFIVHARGESGFVSNGLLMFNSGNFMNWMETQLIPNLPINSVLVIGNAFYHNIPVEKTVTSSTKKNEMVLWLKERNIVFDESMTKSELYEVIKANKSKLPIKYKLDELMEKHGHCVLRLPPYHPELNPLGKIWITVKNLVASSSTTFKLTDIENLTRRKFLEVSTQEWTNACQHVKTHELELIQRDHIFDEAFDSLKFTVNTESSDESDWETDNSNDFLSGSE